MDKIRKAAKNMDSSYLSKNGNSWKSSQVFDRPKGWLNQIKKNIYKDSLANDKTNV